jgi:hypothetical protein
MKKLLMVTFVLMTTIYLSAELMRDPKTFRYYTSPEAKGINQGEYHAMVWQCKDLQKVGAECRVPLHVQNKIITEYLQHIATPTSIRLLEDLKKNNFVF